MIRFILAGHTCCINHKIKQAAAPSSFVCKVSFCLFLLSRLPVSSETLLESVSLVSKIVCNSGWCRYRVRTALTTPTSLQKPRLKVWCMKHLSCPADAGKGAASCGVGGPLPVLVKPQDFKGCLTREESPNGHEREPTFLSLCLMLSLGLFLFILQSVVTKAVFPPVQVLTGLA